MDGMREPPGASLVAALDRLEPSPYLDRIVKETDESVREKMTALVPVLQENGLHAHYVSTSARWAMEGDFFRRDEVRITVETRFRICDEAHPEPAP